MTATDYDDHGRVGTVTSFDNPTPGSGSVINEVAMQYDDWANLALFQVDPDSAIGAQIAPKGRRSSTPSEWKAGSPSIDFVDLAISHDRNSNITAIGDAVLGAGFDVMYAIDDLDRLIDADPFSIWGTIVSNAITSRTRRQQWTLDQVGNWNDVALDLNGDGSLTGTGELDETRTHNLANEILTREPDSSPPPEFTFSHDAAGNMTDDGEEYIHEYDAWYRLVRIRNESTTDLVAEYTYYGNGYRASSHHDTNLDGDVVIRAAHDVRFTVHHHRSRRRLR